jgi:hypothetical protein
MAGRSSHEQGKKLQEEYEPHPDPHALTENEDAAKNKSSRVTPAGYDYEPYPEQSVELEPSRQEVVKRICNLYSGSASEEDMQAYAPEAVYDDPWSYCDSRYKIAGQWYGKPREPSANHGYDVKTN